MTHRTEVDHVAEQLGHDHLLDVGADLHVVPPAGGAQVLHSSHLAREPHTPGAGLYAVMQLYAVAGIYD